MNYFVVLAFFLCYRPLHHHWIWMTPNSIVHRVLCVLSYGDQSDLLAGPFIIRLFFLEEHLGFHASVALEMSFNHVFLYNLKSTSKRIAPYSIASNGFARPLSMVSSMLRYQAQLHRHQHCRKLGHWALTIVTSSSSSKIIGYIFRLFFNFY